MSFRINTNSDAMQAQYYLGLNQLSYSQSVQQLSSGMRINNAGDDAAGLAISQKLLAQVNGLNQATSNAQDGISMVQTADGAMGQIGSMLQRMRELAVEASNGTLSTSDQQAVNTELQQLESQINLLSTQTQFNGLGLLDGSLSTSLNTATSVVQSGFVVAAGTNTSVTGVDVSQAKAGTTFTFANNAGVLTLSDGVNSQAIDLTGTNIAAGGSLALNFDKLGVKLTVGSVTGETGANVAAGLDTNTVITAAGSGAANLQIGANASNTMTVGFSRIDISANNPDARMVTLNTALNTFNGTQSVANAQSLITAVDGAIDFIDGQRANMGAYENRLQDTVATLGIASQNLGNAQSQIQNVDMSTAMVNFSKEQILTQAGVAVLAQANQAPSAVLKLLG
jgi:flagellin